ncbi:MAG: hypothetical protein IJ091_00315 [Oscillospiraceae bacterium]|nr:hypothetical protein [Oscillospiraceae bacterium]
MLINTIIKKEADRNEFMIQQYEALLAELPKGSLVCRKGKYYYLKYREEGKICDKYIGTNKELVADIRSKLELRHHYMEMLSSLKQEQKMIRRMLEEI